MTTYSSLPNLINDAVKSGEMLAGDDLTSNQLETWYLQEKEAYFEKDGAIGDIDRWYSYMRYVNNLLVFNLISNKFLIKDSTDSILFFGTGSGVEALDFYHTYPTWCFSFVESSSEFHDILLSRFKHSSVIESRVDGNLNMENNSQDVVCAFSVLHHIANVTHVITEFHRVLKPGGLAFIREPCSSMGDWRFQRSATPNERGISKKYMLKAASSIGFKCYKQPIPVVFEPINKFLRKINMLERIPFNVIYIIDRILSLLFSINDQYWRDTWFKKIGPSSYLYVFQKK